METPRIMVVEDEKLVALALEKCLRTMGYEVPASVASGEEAVEKALELRPDLILMDIRLKGVIDGVEAARRIGDGCAVPVVYLSAYSEEKTLDRAKHTLPFGYITKPFEERTLQTTVEVALYKAAIDAELDRARKRLEAVMGCIEEAVIVAGADGAVEYMNPAARSMLQGSRGGPDAPLSEIPRFLDSITLLEIRLPVQSVIRTGKSEELTELILAREDRERILVDVSIAPYPGSGGAGRGVVVSIRDVTARRKVREFMSLELRQAQEMQKSLLPRTDHGIPGVKLAWFLHPAGPAAGDLFRVFSVDGRHAVMYIIDVAGRGLTSAVNALLLHRFLAPDPERPGELPLLDADPLKPKEVVDGLAMRLSFGSSLPFFSLLYGVMDVEDGTVKLVRAGVPYPIWQKKDGSLGVLKVEGDALGVSPMLAFTEHEFRMDRGDRLFLYTDGIIECRNPDMTPYSEDRLVSAVRETRTAELTDSVAALDARIMRWRAIRDFDDDVCLQAIERE